MLLSLSCKGRSSLLAQYVRCLPCPGQSPASLRKPHVAKRFMLQQFYRWPPVVCGFVTIEHVGRNRQQRGRSGAGRWVRAGAGFAGGDGRADLRCRRSA